MIKMAPFCLLIWLASFSLNLYSFTLEQAYQLALAEDPQLKSAIAQQKAEVELLNQRLAYLLPEVAFSMEKGFRNTAPDQGNQQVFDNYSISLSMPVVNKELWRNLEAERMKVNQASAVLLQEEQALVERLILAYIDVLEAQVALEINEEIAQAAFRWLEEVKEKHESGLATSSMLSRANADYDLASAQTILAEGDLASHWEGVFRLTNLDQYPQIGRLASTYPVVSLQPFQTRYWVDKALKQSLTLKLAQYDIDIYQKQLASSQARFEPTIDFSASYENIHDDIRVSEEVGRATASLTISLPLYQGGRFDASIREYHHRVDAATDMFEDSRREVRQEARTLVNRLNNNVVFVHALKRSVLSAERALAESKNNYRVGRLSEADMLYTERKAHEAKREYELARYDYLRNQVSLKGVLGELTPEYVAKLSRWISL